MINLKALKLLLFYFFAIITHLSFSQGVDVFKDSTERVNVVSSIKVFTDTTARLSLQEVIKLNQFKSTGNKVPNLGVTAFAHWIQFTVKNETSANYLILEIDNSLIDTLNFYTILPDQSVSVVKSGEMQKITERVYKDQNFIFKVDIPKNEFRTYYLMVKSGDVIVVPIYVSTSQSFYEAHLTKELIFGIYAGIILVMFFYNLFLFFTIRDKNYLYYVFYIFSVGAAQIALQGYFYKYIWPDSPWWVNQTLIYCAVLSGISIVLFMRYFLLMKQYSPFLNKVGNVIIILYLVTVPLRLLGYYNLSYSIVDALAGIISFYALAVGITISVKGYRSAKFFLFAWAIFLIGMFSFVLRNFGVLPYNNFTSYSMPLGNALEVVLLSFALADRINILKKEKEESQAQAFEALKENERMIKEQNVILEAKVDERTQELKKSNNELNITLKELKEAQAQLVSSEKMASLGQLTAGVAHEINNPINFVSSSIKPLKRDFEDIMRIVSKYDELREDNFVQKRKEVDQLIQDLDMEYLKEEINSLLKGIEEGASRTAEIVKGLRTFSRIDETDLKKVDLNEGIDSTLILLNSMMKSNLTVLKQYNTNSKVECYAGKINQVFMNILNNSIHAIQKKDTTKEEFITISTYDKDDNVVVSIKDTGVGMPEEVKAKIFDPFFTTKDVGEGTGLGLSIVYNIIEFHNGKIEVETKVGEGTEFIITLPKIQSN